MQSAFSALPIRSAAVLLGGCLLGVAAGTPSGLSRTGTMEGGVATSVAIAGRTLVFDGVHAKTVRVDRHRVDLIVADKAMGPDAPRAEIAVTLLPASNTPEPELWSSLIHGRFVESEVVTVESGLLMRRFRNDSPYPGELLFVPGELDSSGFAARCHEASSADSPSCLTTLRRNGLDVLIRFPRTMLAQWQSVLGRIESLLADAGRRGVESSA